MRTILIALTGMLLAACQGGERSAAPDGAAEEIPSFVGLWAAEEDLCGEFSWSFTPSDLATPGEVSCTFDDVTKTATGYDIAATCTAEAPAAPYQLRLVPQGSSLRVEGGPFQTITLVACEPGSDG